MDIKNEIGFYFIGSDEDRNIYNLNDFMYEETGWRFGHIDKELLYRKTVELTSSHYHYDYDTTHTFIKDDFSYRSYESLDKTWYDFINNDLKEQTLEDSFTKFKVLQTVIRKRINFKTDALASNERLSSRNDFNSKE